MFWRFIIHHVPQGWRLYYAWSKVRDRHRLTKYAREQELCRLAGAEWQRRILTIDFNAPRPPEFDDAWEDAVKSVK
jgi:hypothetical protein